MWSTPALPTRPNTRAAYFNPSQPTPFPCSPYTITGMPDALKFLSQGTFIHIVHSASLESLHTFQGLAQILAPPENFRQNPMPFHLNSPVPDIEIPAFPTPFDCPAQSHWETQFALRNSPLGQGGSNCTLNQIAATLPPAPLLGCLELLPGSSTFQHSCSEKHMYIPS